MFPKQCLHYGVLTVYSQFPGSSKVDPGGVIAEPPRKVRLAAWLPGCLATACFLGALWGSGALKAGEGHLVARASSP